MICEICDNKIKCSWVCMQKSVNLTVHTTNGSNEQHPSCPKCFKEYKKQLNIIRLLTREKSIANSLSHLSD